MPARRQHHLLLVILVLLPYGLAQRPPGQNRTDEGWAHSDISRSHLVQNSDHTANVSSEGVKVAHHGQAEQAGEHGGGGGHGHGGVGGHGHGGVGGHGHGEQHSGIHLASWRWGEYSSHIMFTGIEKSQILYCTVFILTNCS
jgi:hypothetical protein